MWGVTHETLPTILGHRRQIWLYTDYGVNSYEWKTIRSEQWAGMGYKWPDLRWVYFTQSPWATYQQQQAS